MFLTCFPMNVKSKNVSIQYVYVYTCLVSFTDLKSWRSQTSLHSQFVAYTTQQHTHTLRHAWGFSDRASKRQQKLEWVRVGKRERGGVGKLGLKKTDMEREKDRTGDICLKSFWLFKYWSKMLICIASQHMLTNTHTHTQQFDRATLTSFLLQINQRFKSLIHFRAGIERRRSREREKQERKEGMVGRVRGGKTEKRVSERQRSRGKNMKEIQKG